MNEFHPSYIINGVVYSTVGILVFLTAFAVIGKLSPYNVWKEVGENKNVAMAILVGAMSIGVCTIIAAALH